MRVPVMALALAAIAAPAAAQQRVDETFPSSRTGEVEIVNTAGSVSVIGWDRDEIRVTGTLGRGTERLELAKGRERAEIRVVLPSNARNVQGSDLEIRVPAGKRVAVRTVSADVSVDNVDGAVTARSTSGDVEIRGRSAQVNASSTSGDVDIQAGNATRVVAATTSGDVMVSGTVRESVNAESVSGDVRVTAATPEVRAKAISGDVRLEGVSGRVSASTVSGDAEIHGGRIQYGSFETVSGNFLYAGEIAPGAAFDVQSHSGNIEMVLPREPGAEVEARTFSGEIRSDFGGEIHRTSRHAPGRELRIGGGRGGGLVTLHTFSGTVKLTRR